MNIGKSILYICTIVFIVSLILFTKPVLADDITVERVSCYQESDDSYTVAVEYTTNKKWTDGIKFEVHCKFPDEEITFKYPEGTFINIERGQHAEEIIIHSSYKRRYGMLKSVSVDVYKDSELVVTKDCDLIRRR